MRQAAAARPRADALHFDALARLARRPLRHDPRPAPLPRHLVARHPDGRPRRVLPQGSVPARLPAPRPGPQPPVGLRPAGHPQRHADAGHPRRGRPGRASAPCSGTSSAELQRRQGPRRATACSAATPRRPGRGRILPLQEGPLRRLHDPPTPGRRRLLLPPDARGRRRPPGLLRGDPPGPRADPAPGRRSTKNDCERNAARRWLGRFRRDHPRPEGHRDRGRAEQQRPAHPRPAGRRRAISSWGSRPGDHAHLFDQLGQTLEAGACRDRWRRSTAKTGVSRSYLFANGVTLNESNQDVRVNCGALRGDRRQGREQAVDVGDGPGVDRRRTCGEVVRAGPGAVADRERDVQHAEEPGVPLRAQLRARRARTCRWCWRC